MEKFLIIIPPHNGRTISDFPLGIGYIANQIIKAGLKPEILDINALNLSQNEVLNHIKHSKCRLFGISAFSTQYKYFKWITQEIKKIHENSCIIAGGPLPTHQYGMLLDKTGIDICVVGEGDNTIVDLINNFDNPSQVKGIAFKNNGTTILNEPQKPFNLEELGFHPYHLFPFHVYTTKQKALTVSVSRGCPYKCTFCSHTMPGIRNRPISHIEEELKFLKKRYKIEWIHIPDELFITNDRRGHELCDLFARLGLLWTAQLRVNVADYNLLKYMKRCGCKGLSAGVESGSQKILDSINKQVTVEQNYNFIKNCKKLDIYTWITFIFGYPGEDNDTIKDSIRFLDKIKYVPPNPQAVGKHPISSLITPVPGSKLYSDCIKKGLITDEEEYALKLDKGYYISNIDDIVCNVTSYSDSELINLKNNFERTIWENYRNYENRISIKTLGLIIKLYQDIKIFFLMSKKNTFIKEFKSLLLAIRKRFIFFIHSIEDRSNIPENDY